MAGRDPDGREITIKLREDGTRLSESCRDKQIAMHQWRTDIQIPEGKKCYWVQRVRLACTNALCDRENCKCNELGNESSVEFMEAAPVDNVVPERHGGGYFSAHEFSHNTTRWKCGHKHFLGEVAIFCDDEIVKEIEDEWEKFKLIQVEGSCMSRLQTGPFTLEIPPGSSPPRFWTDVMPDDGKNVVIGGEKKVFPVAYDFKIDFQCCGFDNDFVYPCADPGPACKKPPWGWEE